MNFTRPSVFPYFAVPFAWLFFFCAGWIFFPVGRLSAAPEARSPAQGLDAPSTLTLPIYEPVSESDREIFLKKMTAELAGMRSLRVDFVQERRLSAFLDTLTAKGVCRFEVPDKIRWELTEPYVSILIHNDSRVAKFDLEDGRLRKMRPGAEDVLKQMLGQIMAWMRGDFREARKTYELELQKGKDYLLVLKPRAKGMREMIESVELAIHPDSFRATSVTIREPQSDTVRILFRNERINPVFDPALFDLEHPRYPARDDDEKKAKSDSKGRP